jgi:hypothetical protein
MFSIILISDKIAASKENAQWLSRLRSGLFVPRISRTRGNRRSAKWCLGITATLLAGERRTSFASIESWRLGPVELSGQQHLFSLIRLFVTPRNVPELIQCARGRQQGSDCCARG